MKIKQEHFDKLSQLDRIEFMLKLKRIEENNYGVLYPFIKLMFMVIGFVMLLSIGFYNISKEVFLTLTSLRIPLMRLTIVGIIICLGIDTLSIYSSHKKIKELANKFFKFKVEVRKK